MTTVSQNQLQGFVNRIENLEEEKAATAKDIKEVYTEAGGAGFEVKVLRKLIARRKEERDAIKEFDELLALYEGTLAHNGG